MAARLHPPRRDGQSAPIPLAGAAQEPTPTTPEGGPQEPEPDEPTDDGSDQPGDTTDDGSDDGARHGAPVTAPESSNSDGGGSSALGFLPHTGLELRRSRHSGSALLLTGTALARSVRARRPKTLR